LRLIAGLLAALVLAALLYRRWRRDEAERARAPLRLFGRAMPLLEGGTLEPTGRASYPRLSGRYAGVPVQVVAVVDTLGVRRLPALWMLVTMQTALPVAAKLDFMMRPAGMTTFSNFDLLPHTLVAPAGFPIDGVLRTDDPARAPPAAWLSGHLGIFEQPRAKELLVTPHGLRLVWLLAEAQRARYGVFRQAEFGAVEIEPNVLEDLLQRLLALRESILARAHPEGAAPPGAPDAGARGPS
jgi:hypothetical protein